MKEWTVQIYILDQDNNEHPARCFHKVLYNLHPSFEHPQQSKCFLYPAPDSCAPLFPLFVNLLTVGRVV